MSREKRVELSKGHSRDGACGLLVWRQLPRPASRRKLKILNLLCGRGPPFDCAQGRLRRYTRAVPETGLLPNRHVGLVTKGTGLNAVCEALVGNVRCNSRDSRMKLPKIPKGESDQGSAPDQTAQALLNLRCAVVHCYDGVFVVDPAGNVEFVNPAFELLTGYSAHEAVGSDLGLFEAEGASSAHESILREVQEQGIYRWTLDFRH